MTFQINKGKFNQELRKEKRKEKNKYQSTGILAAVIETALLHHALLTMPKQVFLLVYCFSHVFVHNHEKSNRENLNQSNGIIVVAT
jgi:hypothetical protein